MMILAYYFFIGLLSSTNGQALPDLTLSNAYVDRFKPVVLTCTTGLIYDSVDIYRNGTSIYRCSLPFFPLFPLFPCDNLLNIAEYSVVQDRAAGTTIMTISASNISRDTGSWACQHGAGPVSQAVSLTVGTPLKMTSMTELAEAVVIQTSCTFPAVIVNVTCSLDGASLVFTYSVTTNGSTCTDPNEAALTVTISVKPIQSVTGPGFLYVSVFNGIHRDFRTGIRLYTFSRIPYVGIVGGDAYLNWTISNLAYDVVRYIRNPTESASVMVFDKNKLTPTLIIDTRAMFTGDLLLGIVSFTLSDITLSDAGNYTFTVGAGNLKQILGWQVLVVAESPNTPGITLLSWSAVVGQEYKLNCSTESRSVPFDHNLTMYSEWKKNGMSITMGSGYSVNGTILTISNLSRNDNGDTVTCRAFEKQLKISTESNEFVLNVLYGPDNVQVTPSDVLTVDEGGSINITCMGECNPPCSFYYWMKDSQPTLVGSSQSYLIPAIRRNHAGVYTCTVINMNISKNATAQIKVRVNYGPDSPLQLFPVNASYRLEEGAILPDIYCTSSCFPSCEFHWTGPVPSLTGVISLGRVNRFVRGNYTCSGRNPRTQTLISSSVVTVIVIYGPDTPVLTPSSTEYILNESNILPNIQCSSECFPGCTSYWYREQKKVPGIQSDMLSLGDVYRYDTGTYTCKSENMESRVTGEIVIQLIVQYPPTVKMESRNGSFNETGLMINCTAHGIPERYIYSLIHRSLFSGINIRQLIDNEPVSTGALVHYFRNPSFMDTGVYTCIARNGIPDYRDGSLDKNVSKTVWIRGPPNVTSSDTDFYAEKGHSGRLVIEFYNSLLDASVIWNKQRNQSLEKLETSDKYNMSVANTMVAVKFYSVLIQQPGFIATLEIQNVTEEDFSSYHVYLQNSAGYLSDLILNLRPRETRKQASSENGTSSVIIGSVLGTCIPTAFIVMVIVLLYRRRRLCNNGKSSGQSKTCRSATTEGTNIEGYTTINTVASTGGEKDKNPYLDLQNIAGKTNESVNIRSSDTVTYDTLHPYANNEEHAYSSLNQRPHQKGEKSVYENTKRSEWN